MHHAVLVHCMQFAYERLFVDELSGVRRRSPDGYTDFLLQSHGGVLAQFALIIKKNRSPLGMIGVVNHRKYCTLPRMQMQPPRVVVIVGPTASGKSGLAVRLAKKLSGEIVSADSRQVYKGLNIGTGKVTKKEMAGIPHHLLDVASPKRVFSAGDYTKAAHRAIADIVKRGKLPIVVGGTGFYIDALMGRVDLPNVAPNPKLRASLTGKTAAQLFAMLKKKDAKRAQAMDTPSERNNPVRLIRALEIAASAQPPESPRLDPEALYAPLWLGISPSASVLEKKIRTRLLARIKAGMVAEAKRLKKQGVSYKRMRELGLEYRSLADLLENKITKEQLITTLLSEIRRYARKQTGYWNRNKDIHWFDPTAYAAIERCVKAHISHTAVPNKNRR